MDLSKSGYANGIPAKPVPKVRQNLNKAPELQSPESRNWLLHRHYTRKEFGICKILIQEELERSRGKHEYANYIQGIILRHEGKIQESLECFQICNSLNPKNVDNIKQVARSLFLLGIHNLALEAYLEAESISNTPDWDIYHNLGECWLQLNDRTKAKEALCRAVQLSHHERSYVILADIHLLENDIEGAVDVYKSALEASPDNASLASALGLLYLQQGLYQHALEKLGSALARDPQCARALIAAGAMMQNHGDYDVALSKYKIAANAWPESPALWNNVGMCFYGKKKFVAALSCLKRAHYLSPLDWDVLRNLGLVHLATKQYASAFHFLSAATNLKSGHANTFLLLAITLRHLEDAENAREAFEKASQLDHNDASIPLNYAIFLHSHGQLENAGQQLNRFQQLARSSPKVEPELVQKATQLGAILGAGSRHNKSPQQQQDSDMAVEVQAQVQVRNQGPGSDSSPDSDQETKITQHARSTPKLADDEV